MKAQIFYFIFLLSQINYHVNQLIKFSKGHRKHGFKNSMGNFFIISNQKDYIIYDSKKEIVSQGVFTGDFINGDYCSVKNDLLVGNESNMIYYPNLDSNLKVTASFSYIIFLSFYVSSTDIVYVFGLSSFTQLSITKYEGGILTTKFQVITIMPEANRIFCNQKDLFMYCAFSSNKFPFPVFFTIMKYEIVSFTEILRPTSLNFALNIGTHRIKMKTNSNRKIAICTVAATKDINCQLVSVNSEGTTMNTITFFNVDLKVPDQHDFVFMDNDDIVFVFSNGSILFINIYAYDAISNTIMIKSTINLPKKTLLNYRTVFLEQLEEKVFVLLYHLDGDDYSELVYFHEPKCTLMDITVIRGMTYSFNFNKHIDSIDLEFIIFKSAINTIYGDFSLESGGNIQINKQYSFDTTFKFVAKSVLGEDSLEYHRQTEYPAFDFSTIPCELKVKVNSCFSTCSTCFEIGDGFDHKCVTCIPLYYKYLTNDIGSCYNKNDNIPSTWFLYNDLYYDCSITCKGCTSNQSRDSFTKKYSTNCIECADNAYPYYVLPECRNNVVKEDNIFFFPILKTYFTCFKNCATCSTMNNTISMNCDSCISGKTYNTLTKNCISSNFPSSYQGQYDDYYPCYYKCATCSKEGFDNAHNCDTCLSSYYLMNNTKSCENKDQIITSLPGHYIDSVNKIIYLCYFSCSECKGGGSDENHQCITCEIDYYFKANTDNCYSRNDNINGFYLNTLIIPFVWSPCKQFCQKCNDDVSCIICEPGFYFLMNNCFATCPIGTIIYKWECVIDCFTESTGVKDQCYDIFDPLNQPIDITVRITYLPKEDLIKIIEKDLSQFANANIIKGNDYSIQVINKETNAESQLNAIEHSLIRVNPNECIKKLSLHYNIDEDAIYLIKIDLNQTDSPTNEVNVIYYDIINGKRLDSATLCKSVHILVIYPIISTKDFNINLADRTEEQGYDSFDPTNKLFNQPCTPYTTENNLDITLNDRRNNLYQNITFCQKSCRYEGVNLTKMLVSCTCKSIGEFTLDEISSNFTSNSLNRNNDVIYCYNLVFSQEIIFNYGFWIILCFIIIMTSLSVYIMVWGFKLFINSLRLSPCSSSSSCPPKKETNEKNKEDLKKSNNIFSINKEKEITQVNLRNVCQSKNAIDNIIIKDNNTKTKVNEGMTLATKIITDYNDALEKKIINLCVFYYSFVKRHHPIWKSFFYSMEYEFKFLNIIHFFNILAINCSLNALLYNNSYIEQRYKNNGGFDFQFSLPKSIYAYLLSFIIGFILILFLSPVRDIKKYFNNINKASQEDIKITNKTQESQENLLNIHHNPKDKQMIHYVNTPNTNHHPFASQQINQPFNIIGNYSHIIINNYNIPSSKQNQKKKIQDKKQRLIMIIKCKFWIYIALNYLLLIFFLYYVACFCAVNKNSQIDWLIGCGISFGILMLIPFVFALLFSMTRWISIRFKFEILYILNDIINVII